jgi:hypothetical protein
MANLIDEIKYDLSFLKSHSLQPKWYKILKVFILLGFLMGYYFLFEMKATILYFVAFIFLSIVVHLTYRIKTNKWTTSWLDFVIIEENNELSTKRIGKFYYSAVVFNALLSFIISQVLT